MGKIKCKHCAEYFEKPLREVDIITAYGVKFCSLWHRRSFIADKNKREKEKLRTKNIKKKEKKQNSVPRLKKEADKWFSLYIRTRDALRTTWTITKWKCITCDKINEIKKMDCWHFISRGYTPVRWYQYNAHLQCKFCNWPKAWRQFEHWLAIDTLYWKGVSQEILEKSRVVEKLEQQYLLGIIETYKKLYNNFIQD